MAEKKSTGWGWIIFWLIIFWPVGLFLIIRKLSTDKSALMSGKTGTITVIGWILAVIGGLALIGSDFDFGTIVVGAALLAGGIVLIRKANQTKTMAAKYKKYIDFVVNQNIKSIDHIAASVGLPYETTAKELQDMINLGYLHGSINHETREILLVQNVPVQMVQNAVSGIASGVASAFQTNTTTTARCPGCGANNVVTTGKITECEYCGTPISA
jgi:hypothetical protein